MEIPCSENEIQQSHGSETWNFRITFFMFFFGNVTSRKRKNVFSNYDADDDGDWTPCHPQCFLLKDVARPTVREQNIALRFRLASQNKQFTTNCVRLLALFICLTAVTPDNKLHHGRRSISVCGTYLRKVQAGADMVLSADNKFFNFINNATGLCILKSRTCTYAAYHQIQFGMQSATPGQLRELIQCSLEGVQTKPPHAIKPKLSTQCLCYGIN